MATRYGYSDQALRYDRTRSASPSLVAALLRALEGMPRDGAALLIDVGGGTGNYARALRDAGAMPVVCDRDEAMLAQARRKALPAVRADASALPIATHRVPAVVMVSMLHLVPDWHQALDEARRILVPGGVLVLFVYTRENLRVHWIFDYFPSHKEWIWREHQTAGELLAALPGARLEPFCFEDDADASMAVLCRYPTRLLDVGWWAQTSFLERLAHRDPQALTRGLARLRHDLEIEGRTPEREVAELRERYGDGTIIVWRDGTPR